MGNDTLDAVHDGKWTEKKRGREREGKEERRRWRDGPIFTKVNVVSIASYE